MVQGQERAGLFSCLPQCQWGGGSQALMLGWVCTYWLEQVDERFLLDDYNRRRSDARRLEQGAHGGHDLVEAPSEPSQCHYHVHLGEAKGSGASQV